MMMAMTTNEGVKFTLRSSQICFVGHLGVGKPQSALLRRLLYRESLWYPEWQKGEDPRE